MGVPTEVVVYVDVPANVRVDEGGGERAAGVSGGRIKITSVAESREDAEMQIVDFAEAVDQAAHPPTPVPLTGARAPVADHAGTPNSI